MTLRTHPRRSRRQHLGDDGQPLVTGAALAASALSPSAAGREGHRLKFTRDPVSYDAREEGRRRRPDYFYQRRRASWRPNGDVSCRRGTAGANARVLIRRDGTFIKSFGRKGSGRRDEPYRTRSANGFAGRLFVGDRATHRSRSSTRRNVLDERRSSAVRAPVHDKQDMLYVADSESAPWRPTKAWTRASARSAHAR